MGLHSHDFARGDNEGGRRWLVWWQPGLPEGIQDVPHLGRGEAGVTDQGSS